jgi:hypothetical protein
MADKKFSDFVAATQVQPGDILVGLRAGVNTKFSNVPNSFIWAVNATTSVTLAVNKGYILTAATLCTTVLPTTAAIGDVIGIYGLGTGLFSITQNASQSVVFGNQVTTVGTGGSLTSLSKGDYLYLLCVTANTTFAVIGADGNFTVV